MTSARSRQTGARRSRGQWCAAAEAIMLEELRGARANAQNGDNNFQPEVYNNVAAKLQAAGFNLDADQVRNRWNRYKSAYRIVNFLRGLSGFGWDDARKVVTASEEVWEGLLFDENGNKRKNYNAYNYFRTHPFPEYDEIGDLIGGNAATGEHAFSSSAGADAAPPAPTSSQAPAPQAEQPSGDLEGTQAVDLPVEEEVPIDTDSPNAQEFQAAAPPAPAPAPSPVAAPAPAPSPVPAPPAPAPKHAAPAAGTVLASAPSSLKRKRSLKDDIQELSTGAKALMQSLIEPTTPTSSSPASSSISPLRRKCWEKLRQEGLSPCSNARARRVFRAPEAVKEYLSFGDTDEEAEARAFWLAEEMDNLYAAKFK